MSEAQQRNGKKWQAWTIVAVVALAFVIGAYIYWWQTVHYPSTDDAYVNAHVIQVAPRITGQVSEVDVKQHQHVKKGQLLFVIDPKPFQIAVAKAKANLRLAVQQMQEAKAGVAEADANVKQSQASLLVAEQNAKRTLALVKIGRLPPSQGDDVEGKRREAAASLLAAQNQLLEARAKLGSAGKHNAQVEQAQAALAQAELNLGYTHVKAPVSGTLDNFNIRPGSMVVANSTQFQLIDDGEWWIDTNYKETQLERIQPGQKATITVDMYPKHPFTGRVVAIAKGSGDSFSVLPPENATGNWVKVTQRFPVKILITDPSKSYPLRVGASCEVEVDTVSKVG